MRAKFIKLLPLLAALALGGCVSVGSKKPVGDLAFGVAPDMQLPTLPVVPKSASTTELKPEIWNGDWLCGDGSVVRTEVKDAQHGIVQFTVVKDKPARTEPPMSDSMKQLLAHSGTNAHGLLDYFATGGDKSATPPPDTEGPKTFEVTIRTLGPRRIANLNAKDFSKDATAYLFARVEINEDHLVVYLPDAALFVSLIQEKKVAGALLKNDDGSPSGSTLLEELTGKDCERLEKNGVSVRTLFKEDPDLVLVRIPAKP